MASEYVLRILHLPTNQDVQWAPGREVESNIVDELCNRVAAKGVGIGRTTSHVVTDVRTAMNELLFDLKSQAAKT